MNNMLMGGSNNINCVFILNAGEGPPPTLQSTVIPAWNYAPPTARKSHPNCFAHCKRSTKMKKYKKQLSSQMCKTPWERKSPQWFQTMEIYGQLFTLISH